MWNICQKCAPALASVQVRDRQTGFVPAFASGWLRDRQTETAGCVRLPRPGGARDVDGRREMYCFLQ